MESFGSFCDDFYVSCHLNTEMDLPQERGTVLHYFEQLKKAFPGLTNFYTREPNEYVLEEDKDAGAYRWLTLEPRRLASGYFNPSSFAECHRQNELTLELATPILSVSPIDCEALDVMFGFDLICRGNHDEVVGEAFARGSRFDWLLNLPGARLVEFEPTITIAMDEKCQLQCRVNIVTRTNSYQVRTGQYGDEVISIYLTIRQYWGLGDPGSFLEAYRRQFEVGREMAQAHVVPEIVVPLAEAISTR